MTAIDRSLARFLSFAGRALPWLAGATLLAFGLGLTASLAAPDDYWQGATVQIMFLHVPSAWLITLIWVVMSAAAIITLGWRHPLAGVMAKAAAPLGTAFTFMWLVSGSLWERPMLGTYWVWEGRGASRASGAARRGLDPCRGGHAPGHPVPGGVVEQFAPAGRAGPAIHPAMLTPLLLMALAFVLLFVTLQVAALRNEILRQRVYAGRLAQAAASAGQGCR